MKSLTTAEEALLEVAREALRLCDGASEGTFFAEIDMGDYNRLSAALDKLDVLPELPDPYVGSGPAKAEHALRNP